MRRDTIILTALLLSFSFYYVGCGGEEIDSRWRDREIKIDGDASEWRGTEQYSDDDKGVRFAVFNDGEYLYICFKTWNTKTQQQILVRGLTVWFDAEGGDDRVYGIEFPMTKGSEELRRMRETRSRDRVRAIEDLLIQSRSEMIVGKSKESAGQWMFVEDAMELGIEAALDMDDRILVYELKVPITGGQGFPFPEGLADGGIAGVGFEVGKIDLEEMRDNMMLERPQGGMGGRGGMGGGMRGGGMSNGTREAMTEELEAWMKIKLAAAP